MKSIEEYQQICEQILDMFGQKHYSLDESLDVTTELIIALIKVNIKHIPESEQIIFASKVIEEIYERVFQYIKQK